MTTAIRTYGEAARRMVSAAQYWMGVAQRAQDDESRRYAAAMARRAIELVQHVEQTPARPFGPRLVAVQCLTGCGATVWESAARAWDAANGGEALVARLCPDCAVTARPRAEPGNVSGPILGPAEDQKAAVECIAAIVELDRQLFGAEAEDPENLAVFAIGAFDAMAARWQGLQVYLVVLLGEQAASRALWEAREKTGTAELVRPAQNPDPVVDEKPPGSPQPEPIAPPDEPPQDAEPGPTPGEWVF